MFKITMFSRPKPRGFNYKPIHYDPVQEEREQRRRELLGADAVSPLSKEDVAGHEEKEYEPGQYIRSTGLRRNKAGISSRHVERKNKTSNVRTILILVILVLLLVWIFS